VYLMVWHAAEKKKKRASGHICTAFIYMLKRGAPCAFCSDINHMEDVVSVLEPA
jgi:hypothetical protein